MHERLVNEGVPSCFFKPSIKYLLLQRIQVTYSTVHGLNTLMPFPNDFVQTFGKSIMGSLSEENNTTLYCLFKQKHGLAKLASWIWRKC